MLLSCNVANPSSVLKCDKLQENAEFEEITIGDKNNLPVIDNGLDTKQLFSITEAKMLF